MLADISHAAVGRLLESSSPLRVKSLFTSAERQALADAIAATNATANLLGRARIQERLKRAAKLRGLKDFSDEATAFTAFDETVPVRPLPPEKALRYFQGLYPKLDVDPERFGPQMKRHAFTLAEDTEGTVLDKVKEVISRVLDTGEKVSAAPRMIDQILEGAGIHPRNSAYGELVFRTNMMDSYGIGADEERQAPHVAPFFPAWKFLGILDGRQRPSHQVHFDHYFPNEVTFAEVRDSVKGEFDGFQCRCVAQPVDRWTWAKLQQGGAEVSSFAEVKKFRWVTLESGTHVNIKGDEIVSGPKSLEGKGAGALDKKPEPKPEPKPKAKPAPPAPPTAAPTPTPAMPASPPAAAAPAGKTFDSPEAAHVWGFKASGDWANGLSKDEFKSVGRYMSHEYREVNSGLRSNNGKPPAAIKESVANIDRALSRSKVPEDVTVFRGVGADVAAQMKPGATFKDQGFTSTSLNSAVGEHYGTASMEIRVPKGSQGAYVQTLLKNPKNPGTEQELLLPRGQSFKVVRVEQRGGKPHIVAELVSGGK